MNLFLFITGLILLIVTSLDILTTILQMEGGGIISNRFAKSEWRLLFKLAGKEGRSRILRYAGLIILCLLLLFWILMLWISFSLIFLADKSSVLITSNDFVTESLYKIYYVGYTITSLGNGDVKAGSHFWRMMTNVMAFSGTVFITLSVSYLVPVLQAVTKKRTLAAYIHQLGNTPQDIIKNACNGDDCSKIYTHLNQLQMSILQHSEQHLAYPILNYFHAVDPQDNILISLAKLDEAISIQEVCHLDSEEGLTYWLQVRKAIDHYLLKTNQLSTDKTFITPPVELYEEFLKDFQGPGFRNTSKKWSDLSERRKLLMSLIKEDGWEWEDVVNPNLSVRNHPT